jgi:hypothetical protein
MGMEEIGVSRWPILRLAIVGPLIMLPSVLFGLRFGAAMFPQCVNSVKVMWVVGLDIADTAIVDASRPVLVGDGRTRIASHFQSRVRELGTVC